VFRSIKLTTHALVAISVKRMPAFDAWIDMYAGEIFEQRVNEYIQLVDFACSKASSDMFNEMSKHFILACKLKYIFWDQALALKTWPDFEGMSFILG
jgi:thiaminase